MAETDPPELSKAEPDRPHTLTEISGRCGTCPWNSFEVVIGGWQSDDNRVSSGAVLTSETVVRFPKRSADESVLRFEPEDGDHFRDLDSDRFGIYCDYNYYVADILFVLAKLVVAGHSSILIELSWTRSSVSYYLCVMFLLCLFFLF